MLVEHGPGHINGDSIIGDQAGIRHIARIERNAACAVIGFIDRRRTRDRQCLARNAAGRIVRICDAVICAAMAIIDGRA